MSKTFRESHLLRMLQGFSDQTLPLDVYIRNYLKSHKAIGSHDRKFLAETIYSMIRWLGLIDYICKDDSCWQSRYDAFKELQCKNFQATAEVPSHVSVSFPLKLFSLLVDSLGAEKAREFCLVSNTQAPTTIRVNALKCSREKLYDSWKERYEIGKSPTSSVGIIFKKRENFFGMPEFKEGLFEVQDEGSQLISFLVKARPGDQVLDFCSGSGGKTLAFAPQMEEKGQIYLHDIRKFVLLEAKKRLKRAGIQNSQILHFDDPKKKRLKNKMDWVLVDGPCSGSGTLRRNPDMKWRFDPSELPSLQKEQREIFADALAFVKPGGKIVYATCSILPQENQEQVDYFIAEHGLTLVEPPLQTFPSLGGMDGFFGAVLQKKPAVNRIVCSLHTLCT